MNLLHIVVGGLDHRLTEARLYYKPAKNDTDRVSYAELRVSSCGTLVGWDQLQARGIGRDALEQLLMKEGKRICADWRYPSTPDWLKPSEGKVGDGVEHLLVFEQK